MRARPIKNQTTENVPKILTQHENQPSVAEQDFTREIESSHLELHQWERHTNLADRPTVRDKLAWPLRFEIRHYLLAVSARVEKEAEGH